MLWEARIRRINDSRQLERLGNVSVLAEVAQLPVRHSVAGPKPRRRSGRALELYEESIDSLRTCLILPDSRQALQVLAVTSAVPDEGKTSLATQLVLSIARAARKPTLLIDTDLRSPDIHRIFRIDNEPGSQSCWTANALWMRLSTRNGASVCTSFRPDGCTRVRTSCLAAVVSQRYSTKRVPDIRTSLSTLRRSWQPVNHSSSARCVTAHCCLQCAGEAARIRSSSHRRLQSAGGNPLGAVLNAVPTRSYEFMYGKYGYRLAQRSSRG